MPQEWPKKWQKDTHTKKKKERKKGECLAVIPEWLQTSSGSNLLLSKSYWTFFFLAPPPARGRFWVRDRTGATDTTCATAVATPDPQPVVPQGNFHGELFFFLFSLAASWHMAFPGQGSDPSCSLELRHGCGHAGFLNPVCRATDRTCNPALQRCHRSLCTTAGNPIMNFFWNWFLSCFPEAFSCGTRETRESSYIFLKHFH